MNSLFIDATQTKITIAYLTRNMKGSEKIFKKTWTSKRDEIEKIPQALEEIFKKAKTDPQKIDEVFVVPGPGPFTGVRIGIVTANTIAFWNNARVYPVEKKILESKITPETFTKWRKKITPVDAAEAEYGGTVEITKSKKEVLIPLKD